jgi:hypothetical protein
VGPLLEGIKALSIEEMVGVDNNAKALSAFESFKNGEPDDVRKAIVGVMSVWAAVSVLERDPSSDELIKKVESHLMIHEGVLFWDRIVLHDPNMRKLKKMLKDATHEAYELSGQYAAPPAKSDGKTSVGSNTGRDDGDDDDEEDDDN